MINFMINVKKTEILFVLELCIRMCADGLNFFRDEERWWNIMDIAGISLAYDTAYICIYHYMYCYKSLLLYVS